MQAVLILAHKDPAQVLALADYLNGHFDIYIHFDRKCALDPSTLEEFSRRKIHVFQKYQVNWGSYSIVRATLLLMRQALKNPDNSYFHIISGQDWPARTPDRIYDFFEHTDQIFMRIAPAEGVRKSGEPIILWQQYYYPYDRIQRKTTFGKIFHRVSIGFQTLARVNKYKKYGIKQTIFQGSQWADIPRDALEFMLSEYKESKNLQMLFSSGFCPDEFWMQTILGNSPLAERVTGSNLRFIKWEKQHGSYPAILDESSYTEILESGCLFFRKVDRIISSNLIDSFTFEKK